MWALQVAERCLKKAKDLSGLLLLHTARGSEQGLTSLASDAQQAGKQNVSFLSRFLLGKVDECIDVLIASGRIPEAAFFARTYKPSRISEASLTHAKSNLLLCDDRYSKRRSDRWTKPSALAASACSS